MTYNWTAVFSIKGYSLIIVSCTTVNLTNYCTWLFLFIKTMIKVVNEKFFSVQLFSPLFEHDDLHDSSYIFRKRIWVITSEATLFTLLNTILLPHLVLLTFWVIMVQYYTARVLGILTVGIMLCHLLSNVLIICHRKHAEGFLLLSTCFNIKIAALTKSFYIK